MQDVTDLAFLNVLTKRSSADVYVTEYFRVHPESRPNHWILRSITENPTGRPIFAQMIGNDIPSLVRTAKALQEYPVAGIDLNLGCPAPVVYNKNAGGGLLRLLEHVDQILTALRDAVDKKFTVKTRIGFESEGEFDAILELFAKHKIDLLTIHGRTVREKYQTPVHPEQIAKAVRLLPFPVIANGNVVDVATGASLLRQTNAAGLMIGRGAIRNPWIFAQLRASFSGDEIPQPSSRDVLHYIVDLLDELTRHCVYREFDPAKLVQRAKKFTNFVTQGYPEDFEKELRRARTREEFIAICERFLDHDAPAPPLPQPDSSLFCGFTELL